MLNNIDDITTVMRPAIRPSAIFIRPPTHDELRKLIFEICEDISKHPHKSEKDVFIIKSGTTKYRTKLSNISFFESRGKKLAMKTKLQEIEFYSTLNNTIEQLPDSFIRCHKGYIVNTNYILSVNVSSMTIELSDGCTVPFSRTYRNVVKQAISY